MGRCRQLLGLRLSLQFRQLMLGVFALYLFGWLGYLGTGHKHAPSDHSHPECQLCQVTVQPYAAPEPLVCPENPAVPVLVVEAVWEPILAFRFKPFASRAPPFA